MVRLINYLLYQIGWFACVLGAAYARPWLGIALALPLVAAHFWLTTDRAGQIKMAVFATVIGLFVDGTLLGLGVFRFPSGVLVSGLPPLWMSVLWIQFATTFAYCLHWLSGRYALSALLGLFGAPLAFLGGARLGAIEISPARWNPLADARCSVERRDTRAGLLLGPHPISRRAPCELSRIREGLTGWKPVLR
jgi:hypothetical protein